MLRRNQLGWYIRKGTTVEDGKIIERKSLMSYIVDEQTTQRTMKLRLIVCISGHYVQGRHIDRVHSKSVCEGEWAVDTQPAPTLGTRHLPTMPKQHILLCTTLEAILSDHHTSQSMAQWYSRLYLVPQQLQAPSSNLRAADNSSLQKYTIDVGSILSHSAVVLKGRGICYGGPLL